MSVREPAAVSPTPEETPGETPGERPEEGERTLGEALELSILIVSYNTRELTLACLHSIESLLTGVRYEVLVVDNASADGSEEAIRAAYPKVRVLAPGSNLGFGRATNLAARSARGERLLLLNPDTEILEGSIEAMLAFAKTAGDKLLLGGRTFYADGRLEPRSCCGNLSLWSVFCMATGLSRLAPGSRLLDPESLGSWQRDTRRDVDIIAGCLLMVKRSFWEDLGGFDEDFFMYGEDYDLCMRAWKAGGRCTILPEAKIVHHVGASEGVRADRIIKIFGARTQLCRKHWSGLRTWACVRLFDAWAFSRMVGLRFAALFSARFAGPAETWSAIWAGRREWHA